ncbi:UBX domain-containing protein 1-B [Daphnia magna]|uniref:UBX domain-containing protein 1 n=1 Tax=Daphnia magna TaxID=35525 RepID=A0A0P5ZSV9_9CRUS|nr:UBX domain-containing protein 1-B [Daphnia magna]KZS17603.1 UBX domain-containing protein 1 [Daphnia magna]
MSSNLQSLLEMGFSQQLAEKAIQETGDQNIEVAMDWLIVNSEKYSQQLDNTQPKTEECAASEAEVSRTETASTAKSIKCDECNRLFSSSSEIEFHAAKTGHSQFSESTDEKKPLTEEEKKEQLRKVEELMKLKRKEREEKEKAEQLEQEKRRIQSGKELLSIKKKFEEDEIRKIAEERRREKEEEKKARQRVKEQIEQDKLARKQKAGNLATTPVVIPPVQPSVPVTPSQPKDYKETRIQIRLPNGSTMTQTFGAKEQLASVRLFIQMNRTDLVAGVSEPFRIQTNFPRKIFTEEEYEKPLDILGLVPSAVLMVSKA